MNYSTDIRVVEDNIISLLRSKDTRGIELLYDRYGNIIYGFIFHVLQSDKMAEEAIDEVFMRVWRTIDTYDSKKTRLFTWLINLTRHSVKGKLKINHLNKINGLLTGEISDDYNPDSTGIKELVKQLDKKQRQLLEDIYFAGSDFKIISQNTDLPVNNLKSMVRSVLKMMQVKTLAT